MSNNIKEVMFAFLSLFVNLLLLSCSSPTKPDKVADLVFIPPAGNYAQAQQVSISCATDGAEIRYTLDGSTPPTNSVVYTGPFTVELGTTVKAIASKTGMGNSKIIQAFYSGIVPTPSFGSAPHIFYPSRPVYIYINHVPYPDDWPDGMIVRYTLDGTEPDSTSNLYEGGIFLIESCTVKVRAYRWNWTPSSVISADLTAIPQLNIISSCDTPGSARGIAVAGDYAYIALSGGLQIINISNPSLPYIVGIWDTPSSVNEVVIIGNYAYIANASAGLQIINISNPSSPYIVGTCDTPGSSQGIAFAGSNVYIADYNEGLQVINILNPSNPYIVGSCDTPGSARGVAVEGNYAYIADYNARIQVINISNPSAPYIAGSCETPDNANKIDVADSYAFVAVEAAGLHVINISSSSAPFIIGFCDIPDRAIGISIVGGFAYVASRYYGLHVINIYNPSSPYVSSSCDTPDYAYDVAIMGRYAYVADGISGLQIIDLE